jgi:hypothetical protein
VHPAATKLDEEEDVEPVAKTVSTVKKSHASMLAASPRMNSRQETPALWPAGPSPASCRSLRIVVVATAEALDVSEPSFRTAAGTVAVLAGAEGLFRRPPRPNGRSPAGAPRSSR